MAVKKKTTKKTTKKAAKKSAAAAIPKKERPPFDGNFKKLVIVESPAKARKIAGYLGDEYIFITDALRAGLAGVHLPITVAVHPVESSGSKWGTTEDLQARSKVFTRVFGWKAPIYRAAFLVKTKNPWPGVMKAIRFIFTI